MLQNEIRFTSEQLRIIFSDEQLSFVIEEFNLSEGKTVKRWNLSKEESEERALKSVIVWLAGHHSSVTSEMIIGSSMYDEHRNRILAALLWFQHTSTDKNGSLIGKAILKAILPKDVLDLRGINWRSYGFNCWPNNPTWFRSKKSCEEDYIKIFFPSLYDQSLPILRRIWEQISNSNMTFLNGQDHPRYLTVLSDGRLVSCSSEGIRIWNIQTQTCELRLEIRGVTSLQSLTNRQFASGAKDKMIRIWDAHIGSCIRILEGHHDEISCLALLKNGYLASGSIDKMIRIWDIQTGRCIRILEGHGSTVTVLQVLSNSELASSGYDREIRIWDVETGRCIRILEGYGEHVTALQALSNGKLVSGGKVVCGGRYCRIWNIQTGRCEKMFELSANYLQVLSDGRLAIVGDGEPLKILDIQTGKYEQKMFEEYNLWGSLQVLPDGRLASIMGDYGVSAIYIWDLRNPSVLEKSSTNVVAISSYSDTVLTDDAQSQKFSITNTGDISRGLPDKSNLNAEQEPLSIVQVDNSKSTDSTHRQEQAPPVQPLVSYMDMVPNITTGSPAYSRNKPETNSTISSSVIDKADESYIKNHISNLYSYDGEMKRNATQVLLELAYNHPKNRDLIVEIIDSTCGMTFFESLFDGFSSNDIQKHINDISSSIAWKRNNAKSALIRGLRMKTQVVEKTELGLKSNDYPKTTASVAKDKQSDVITMDLESLKETNPIKASITPPESFKTMISTPTLPSISAGEYVAFTSEIERIKSAVKTSEKDLSEELQALQEQIKTQSNEAQLGLTAEEKQRLQIRIREDKAKESLLMERQTILMNPNQKEYYETLQTHISELMVVSLGVGSGYVAINNSKGAQAVSWVCTAISSAFPGASLVTSVVNSGVSYLDSKYREWVLERIRVFGTTIKDAEALGEEVARLLVRAHYYADLPLSRKKADKDAQALITAIVKANPPMIRDEDAARRLFEIVWGNTAYYIELLPVELSQKGPERPAEPPEHSKVFLAASFNQPIHLTVTNPESSPEPNQVTDAQTLTQQLSEKDKKILQVEEELARIKAQIGNLATKSDVVSKQEMAPLKADIAQLKGHANTGGHGQILMSRTVHMQGTDVSEQEKSEKRLVYVESHVGLVSEEVVKLQAENESNKAEIAELKKLLAAAKILPQQSIFPAASIPQSSVANEPLLSSTDDAALKRDKKTLFSK